jgi:hypothetical protein
MLLGHWSILVSLTLSSQKLVTHQQLQYLLNLPSLINSAFVGE